MNLNGFVIHRLAILWQYFIVWNNWSYSVSLNATLQQYWIANRKQFPFVLCMEIVYVVFELVLMLFAVVCLAMHKFDVKCILKYGEAHRNIHKSGTGYSRCWFYEFNSSSSKLGDIRSLHCVLLQIFKFIETDEYFYVVYCCRPLVGAFETETQRTEAFVVWLEIFQSTDDTLKIQFTVFCLEKFRTSSNIINSSFNLQSLTDRFLSNNSYTLKKQQKTHQFVLA